VALVTGANHGIGAATARALADRGAGVLVTYLRVEDPPDGGTPEAYRKNREQDGEAIVAAIRAAGGRAEAIQADLLDQMAAGLRDGSVLDRSDDWLGQARSLGSEIERVDDALRQAEDSVRLNPRGLRLVDTPVSLRSRLETLEHAAITVRGLARSLADSIRLAEADSLIAIGRGPTLAIAREAALKLKEIANRHAEAFSGAEFLHGPVALVEPRYPVLMFVPDDAAAEGLWRLAGDLAGKGAALFIAAPRNDKTTGPQSLPTLASDHPETDAVCLIQSFYAMMVGLAERLGIDPDRPRHLQKITRTR